MWFMEKMHKTHGYNNGKHINDSELEIKWKLYNNCCNNLNEI